jgi:hypothetical protein
MAEAESSRIDVRTEVLFRALLDKLGLGQVACMACARALLPWPFGWESYTYTSTSGQSWTWDTGCARALTRRRSRAEQVLIEHTELTEVLDKQCRVDEQHLHHIPLEKRDEPILLAPVPDGQGYAVVDGSHRATLRVRAGRDVHALLLTPGESAMAIEAAPMAMHRIALELQRQHLLPPEALAIARLRPTTRPGAFQSVRVTLR